MTIAYSKEKAKEIRRKLEFIENKLKECERLCAAKPTESDIENFQKYKLEYDSLFDYIAQGNIVWSRATKPDSRPKWAVYTQFLTKTARKPYPLGQHIPTWLI